MTQLTLKSVGKSGNPTYGIPGVGGGITVSKKILANGAEPPETLDVAYDGFKPPDYDRAARISNRTTRNPEERLAQVRDKAEKAAQRAAKAAETLAKLQARLGA